jgi:prolyl oligopeptidase
MTLVPRGHPDQYLFGFSTLIESWGTYRHIPGAPDVETLKEPEVRVDDAVIEDHWATSADGTRVPYHVVRRTDVSPDAVQPALIYAYGGFNAPWVPQFPGANAAFVDAGGLFVHAHLRGGAEFGLEWWHGGRMETKQNCYDDLYAIAEDLIARGRTSADRLSVTGGSNGGLMSGVAVTQRPDLWRAVVPRMPFLDVIGACREVYGRYAVIIEFGDPDNPDDVRRLAGYSPYHNVVEGTPYPAVYIDAGDTDPRCPPWHARKLAAALQAATSSDRPILLRVWENVGHGWATAKDVEVQEFTQMLAFLMDQLAMNEGSL